MLLPLRAMSGAGFAEISRKTKCTLKRDSRLDKVWAVHGDNFMNNCTSSYPVRRPSALAPQCSASATSCSEIKHSGTEVLWN